MNRKHSILAPSLLAGNHAALGESLRLVEGHGLSWVHLDIMDGHFVPNLSFGPQTVKDLRKMASDQLFFDTHLMLSRPDLYVDAFLDAGANQIIIHVEPDYPLRETMDKIKKAGCGLGLAINPDTPLQDTLPYLPDLDLLLCMTVQPGFGGQKFRKDVLPKIKQAQQWREEKGYGYRIEVDGGVDLQTAPLCAAEGADTFVCGTAFFKAEDLREFASEIEALPNGAK